MIEFGEEVYRLVLESVLWTLWTILVFLMSTRKLRERLRETDLWADAYFHRCQRLSSWFYHRCDACTHGVGPISDEEKKAEAICED